MEKKNATMEKNTALFLQKHDTNSFYSDTMEFFIASFSFCTAIML
jgi:hypothetical protein